MKPFVDAHRPRFGVEPICKALQAAPSAYWRETARERQPSLCPPRLQREAAQMPQIQQVSKSNMSVYGADKVWRALKRQDVEVARCTVERLMRRLGVRTTVFDAKGQLARRTASTGCSGRIGPTSCGSATSPASAALTSEPGRASSTWPSRLTKWRDVFARRIVGGRVKLVNAHRLRAGRAGAGAV